MNPERWQQIKSLLNAALERAPGERAAFLDEACAAHPSLRSEVESLIASYDQAGAFIESPAVQSMATSLEDGTDSLAGQSFGPYQIEVRIGAGGMGEVYLAHDSRLGRKVALKMLPDYFTKDDERVRRFQQEARAASALNHPNILTIYEIGQIDSRYFIATEFIEGETLRHSMMKREMKLAEILDAGVQVASALAAAHQAGITHRDIKSENIMVREDGFVKVLDFGLAKLMEPKAIIADTEAQTRIMVKSEPGIVMGTVTFMSPEQARGGEVDHRTDIWSLGVVLYEMVARRLPFEGSTTHELLASILSDKEPPPLARYAREVPAELDRILTKALHKNRDERYQVIKDLGLDLKSLKHRLEFEAELERTVPPESTDGAARVTRSGGQAATATGAEPTTHPTSSAEYVVSEIKHHKRAAIIVLAALIVAVAAVILFYARPAPALTEKDTILLADFVNTTGEDVFDGTLKQALAVQLEQSPFLNIFPDQRVRETLRYMGRSPDERVTREVAREICERQSIKAMLTGSISSLGSHYAILLEATNSRTGEALAREQVEAEGKEQVLRKLGEAASKLRERMGESLSLIEKFNAPLEQATTSSLEALKAYSLAREQLRRGKYFEAIPLYKRAVELDPNFAQAYSGLATVYFGIQQHDLAAQSSEKAFELRERTSEREKFSISSRYYTDVLGDGDKAIEILELWKQTYPRDYVPRNNVAIPYIVIGQYEKAIEELREAVRLNPDASGAYGNLALCFMGLNRNDEAKAIIEQALARKLDNPNYHYLLYSIAVLAGDTAAMRAEVDGAAGKPTEPGMLVHQSATAGFAGQSHRARELSGRAIELSQRLNLKEPAAHYAAGDALREAVFGNCREAKDKSARALAIARGRFPLSSSALALAVCGEVNRAQPLADEMVRRFPQDTYLKAFWLPMIRAAIEINRNNPAQAVQLLQVASRGETGANAFLLPAYIRGLAYLRGRAGNEAMVEFQKILDHKGLLAPKLFNSASYSIYPLAHLGLARAAALTGDTARSRKAYQDFFALWKDADPDNPILLEARREYEKLK